MTADRQVVVLKTASLMAGFRASDNNAPESFAQDVLAGPLGGNDFAKHLEGIYKELQGGQLWEWDAYGRRVVTWGASRPRFLDQEVLTALGGILPASPKHAPAGDIHAQVVVLGSGLDSRPWRLPMPAHVAWYEVDWPDCISGKHARLADIGAATSHSEAAAKYPLKPASWAGVATDLAQPGFIGDLEAAGFSRALPSVFLCEGLLYYLQPGQVDSLLQTLAKAGPVGSTLLADAKDAAWLAHDAYMAEKHWKTEADFIKKMVSTFHAAVPFDCTEQLAQAGWTLEAATDAKGWAKAHGRTPAGDIGQSTQKGIATEDVSAWSRRHWFVFKAALY